MDPGKFGWDADTKIFANSLRQSIELTFDRLVLVRLQQRVSITLLKTMPTIVASFLEAFRSLTRGAAANRSRTEKDLSIFVVVLGSIVLIALMAVLPEYLETLCLTK